MLGICQRCNQQFDRPGKAKYCLECVKVNNLESKARCRATYHLRANQPLICPDCGDNYSLAGRPAAKYCVPCGVRRQKESSRRGTDKWQVRVLGRRIGVGSGNAQGRGVEHHSWKTGIGAYKRMALENLEFVCSRCSLQLDRSIKGSWCTHHKDHDRTNNSLDNLELLCKKCHQREHNAGTAPRRRRTPARS